MNSSGFDIVSVIFLGIAVVLFLYLRSILGSRTGHESSYGRDSQDNPPPQRQNERDDNVISMPERREMETNHVPIPETNIEEQIEKFAEEGTPLAEGLKEIASHDQTFDPEQFMQGAERAYEMIIAAFSEGDKRQLKRLLAKDVLEGFNQAIDERNANKHAMTTRFVGYDAVTMLEAAVEDRQSEITVKYKTSLIRYVTDATGDIIEGDEKEIEKITDIWTFARNINGRDPNWKLISTKSES